MPVESGSHLGPYEILSAIGAGGMGEVYRARDKRLDRTIAVKVLAPNLSGNPEYRQRFEREARTVAALSHPHICPVYDIGAQDGVDYLVIEYLEGENLASRIAKRPLPIDEALRYAIQIADAVDQAHRHGVVHRDLKPGNIMLTKSGAKLLDFGLAKMYEPRADTSGSATALPTATSPLTRDYEACEVQPLWSALAASICAAVLFAWLHFNERPAPPQPAVRFAIPAPAEAAFLSGVDIPVLSPDGARLVFTGSLRTGSRVLWYQPLDTLETKPLPGTESAVLPFWSPDSRSVAFYSETDKMLKKADVSGGSALPVCAARNGSASGAWLPDGTIIFYDDGLRCVFRPSAGSQNLCSAATYLLGRWHSYGREPFRTDGTFCFSLSGRKRRKKASTPPT
jgi:serine/threonine protein kinase